ncbi:hypothetical protein IWQ60_005641 [Tieghemiomyces parasiticus]|uniref:ATP synthase subunit K, mitochondrial n=1 Tax=Tieghemiomyces parasiticus TaxID=78921 RepID=A0A9W8DY20_9FUNG|nr:hypothetical protein IWQ60_012474 [Tieghemiomyces parasiticus]KAJ1923802.1 hypothetical protein IWQ60_005641 [Tieghemiomyces parasiticus]
MAGGYNILGQFIKSEYLVIATFATVGGLTYSVKKSMAGAPNKENIPPIVASSQEEENFIKEFIKAAEADDSTSKPAQH